LLIGGWGGYQRFGEIYSPEEQCASCHVGEDLEALAEAEAPHSVDYFSICHSCHVLPVRAYLNASLGSVGISTTAEAGEGDDPVPHGSDCMGRHQRLGRADMDCGFCHDEPGEEVEAVPQCSACHTERMPAAPHDVSSCVACHVETITNPRQMAKMSLSDEERQVELAEMRSRQDAGTSMKTKDQVEALPGEQGGDHE
jgi:hypothetical protein